MLHLSLGDVDALLSALEQRRPAVAMHCRRVSALSVRLAMQYEWDRDTLETVRLGALLHDVGKLVISTRTFDTPGRPSDREWQELRIHPQLGMDVAHRAGFDNDVCGIILYHHERFDGQGYPDRLAGLATPVTARVVAVMDSFDAMTSTRDPRKRRSIDAARRLIARDAGTRYCPWVVSGFLALPAAMLAPSEGKAPAVEWDERAGPWMSPPESLVKPWLGLEAGVGN